MADLHIIDSFSFKYDQSVSGNGFSSSYKYTLMPNIFYTGVESKNQYHGSGSIDNSYTEQAYSVYRLDLIPEQDIDEEDAASEIQSQESNLMTFSPIALAVNDGYYARNPIHFASSLQDQTRLKNYDLAVSMKNEISQAKFLRKDASVLLNSIDDYSINNAYQGDSIFKIDESFENGRASIGFLDLEYQGEQEIQEDYVGTFDLKKNLTHRYREFYDYDEDYWLPCCDVGLSGMDTQERKQWREINAFDCNCYRPMTAV